MGRQDSGRMVMRHFVVLAMCVAGCGHCVALEGDVHQLQSDLPPMPKPLAMLELPEVTEPESLKTVMENVGSNEKQALLEIQMAESRAQARRKAKKMAHLKESKLLTAAKLLSVKLEKATKMRDSVVAVATKAQATAYHRAATAKEAKARRDAIASKLYVLNHNAKAYKQRYTQSLKVTKAFLQRTQAVAKRKVANANEQAVEMVREAKAQAKVLRLKARQESQAALKRATAQAAEMREDSRSELASTRRKAQHAETEAEKAKADFESAETEAWSSMGKAESAQEIAKRASQMQEAASAAESRAREEELGFKQENAALLV